eukprot:866189-Pelagomonas_calceolata.AAC.1
MSLPNSQKNNKRGKGQCRQCCDPSPLFGVAPSLEIWQFNAHGGQWTMHGRSFSDHKISCLS